MLFVGSSCFAFYHFIIERIILSFVLECDCFEDGSRDSQCSINGKCDCRPGFSGLKCEKVDQELLLWNDAFEDKIDSLDKVGIFGRFSNSSTLLTLMRTPLHDFILH